MFRAPICDADDSSDSLMMVGIGGNNGTILCATTFASRHCITLGTKNDIQHLNHKGSSRLNLLP
jgi:hypothetical protein